MCFCLLEICEVFCLFIILKDAGYFLKCFTFIPVSVDSVYCIFAPDCLLFNLNSVDFYNLIF